MYLPARELLKIKNLGKSYIFLGAQTLVGIIKPVVAGSGRNALPTEQL